MMPADTDGSEVPAQAERCALRFEAGKRPPLHGRRLSSGLQSFVHVSV